MYREKCEATHATWSPPWMHTYRFVLPSFQQSVQMASRVHSQLKRQFFNPTDGSGYGLFCHRSGIFLPFHRLLRNPERNHMGLSRGSGQHSYRPSGPQLQATNHLTTPELKERTHSSQPSKSYQQNRQAA